MEMFAKMKMTFYIVLLLVTSYFFRSVNSNCLYDLYVTTYAGNVSITNNGLTCQAWSAQTPHAHTLFPQGSVTEASNFCRDVYGVGRPGCYTTHPTIEWEFCTFSICTGLAQKCGEKVRKRKGTLLAPDSDRDGIHDPFFDCLWTIEAKEDEVFQYKFSILSAENCYSQYIRITEIIEGAPKHWTIMCRQSDVVNSGETVNNVLFVWLTSDDGIQSTSLSFAFQVVKATDKRYREFLQNSSGWISAPDLDGDGLYEHNLHCLWIVDVDADHFIFQFVYLAVEWAENCGKDRIEIYDDVDVIFRYCAAIEYLDKENLVTMKTRTGLLAVFFKSDTTFSDRGFNLTYQAVINSTDPAPMTDCLDELLTSRYAGNVSITNNGHACQSWSSQTPHRHQLIIDAFFPIDGSVENAKNFCRDFDGFAIGRPWCYTTEPDIVWEYCSFSICSDVELQKCGGVLEISAGYLTSPELTSDNYQNYNADCLWKIQVPESYVIRYKITMIDIPLEDCQNYRLLVLYDDASLEDEEKALCELAYIGQTGETTAHILYLHFYADNNINRPKFNMTFRAIEAFKTDYTVVLDDSPGWISSPDYDGDNQYDFHLNCLWHIKAVNQSTAVVKPLYIKLVRTLDVNGICILDYLSVEDEFGERGRYCGYHNGTIPHYESRRFSLIVRFYSDSFLSSPGFNLSYHTYKKPVDCLDDLTLSRYLGQVAVTNHGYTCRPWASYATNVDEEDFIHDGGIEEARNYCRNINRNTKPYCLTTDPFLTTDLCTFSICYGQTQAFEERLLNQTGWITAPDLDGDGLYDLNVDCLWKLEAPIGFRIRFTLLYLDIEKSLTCSKDQLQIMAITNRYHNNIYLCGFSSKPSTGESSTRILFVEFYSDNSYQYTGFNLSYHHSEETNKRCQENNNIKEKSGWLTAPDFDGDGNYDHNLICRWTVEAEIDHVVAVQLVHIDIQDSEDCKSDYLWILDADSILEAYCGVFDMMEILETKSYLLNVYFVSDAFIAASGFNLTYQQIKRIYSCWEQLLAIPYAGTVAVTNNGHSCQPWSSQTPHSHSQNTDIFFPVDGSVTEAKNYCRDIWRTGKPWCYTTDPDILWGYCTLVICKDRVEDCGGIVETEAGVITSPDSDGDGHYDLNMDCLWIIKASRGRIIRYRLIGLFIADCAFDRLMIYEGPSSIYAVCGKWSNEIGETASNVLYIQFFSNHFDTCFTETCGFGIAFHLKEGSHEVCGETLTSTSGLISSPDRDGDGLYDFNLKCHWIVKVNHTMSISFQILKLRTRNKGSCDNDVLYMYELIPAMIRELNDINGDGPFRENSFGRYCGESETQNAIKTRSNKLHVEFITDGIFSSNGFNITYSEVKRQMCGAILKKQTGWIQQPDVDKDGLYDSNVFCKWKILATTNKNIEIDIIFIRIESSPECINDQLQIGNVIFCGEYGRQEPMKMIGYLVNIIFWSDFINNDDGFLIYYQNVEATRQPSKIEITSFPGEIKVPEKEDIEYYDHNLVTIWDIVSEHGKTIVFKLLYMDIEMHQGICSIDRLQISTTGRSHLILCGQISNKLVFASDTEMLVSFMSDNSVNGLGFAATYTELDGEVRVCRDKYTLTSPSQYITQTGNSIITKECHWTIVLKSDKVMVFKVLEMYITKCEEETNFMVNEDHLPGKTYCGASYDSFTTEYNKLSLLYHPYDVSEYNKGFKAVYFQAEDMWICSTEYKCLRADKSVPRHYLCDGYNDCPNGDDERFCSFRCPPDCTCLGLTVDCSGKRTPCDFDSNTTSGPQHTTTLSASTRVLDIARNHDMFSRLKLEQQKLPFLEHLNISFCNIPHLPNDFFLNMNKLVLLDISYNKIKRLVSRIFSPLSDLTSLFFEGNSELLILDSECFYGLHSLTRLNLTNLHIERISKNAFSSLQLKELKIYSSIIDEVEQYFLGNLLSESFHFNSSKIKTFTKEMFQGINDLSLFVTDEYKYCCVRPSYLPEDSCYPHKSELSFCEDLVEIEYLRPVIWLIALLIVIGNAATIVYRFVHYKTQTKHCYSIFVSNLAFSDFLMGIYLIIIAVADTSYRGRYIFNDEAWRANPWCNLAGILSTMSSEASLIFICVITVDRFLVIKYPFGQHRLTVKVGTIIVIVGWLLALLVAALPEAVLGGKFYSQSGFCMALPITTVRGPGWIFAFCLFVVVNTIFCLFVALGQWYIYKEIQTTTKSVDKGRSKNRKDARVAWNLLLVAVTDFLCWIPVDALSFWALMGNAVSVDIYIWMAIVILPMNSVINPILYSFSTMIQERKLKQPTKRKGETPANMIHADQLEKCLSIFQNPAYIQAAGIVEGYKTLTDILQEDHDWFGNQQRILVAIKVAKLLCETHVVRLRLARLTIDDILLKRTDIKPHVRVCFVYRPEKVIKQSEYVENISSLAMILSTLTKKSLRKTNSS